MTVVTREEELVGSEKGIEPYSATEVKVENGRFINWNQPISPSPAHHVSRSPRPTGFGGDGQIRRASVSAFLFRSGEDDVNISAFLSLADVISDKAEHILL